MSKNMKYFLMIVIITVFAIAGCQSDNSPEKLQDGSNSESEVDLSESDNKEDLEGEIRISLASGGGHSGGQDVWESIADAYMDKNPNVKVIVDNKPLDGYEEWLTAQFSTGNVPEADIVNMNLVRNLAADKKFVDFIPYLEQENTYTNKLWKDSFDLDTMQVNIDSYKANEEELYELNFESLQVMWLYNKEILSEAGYDQPPETFDELITMFEDVEKIGYTPFSIGGDSDSLWSGKAGWIFRIYPDQYFRDSVLITHSREEDYSYFAPLDSKWEYDLSDPYNDNLSKVTYNNLRMWKAIYEKEGPYGVEDNPGWEAYLENMKKLFSFAPNGFLGNSDEDSYKQFLNGEAATMLGDPSLFWQIPKDLNAEGTGGLDEFEFGFFNFPTIEDDLVQADVRTIHVPLGFYAVVAKDAKQNELNIDFLQYWTSPEGYEIYLEAIENSESMSLAGPPALKDIELPTELNETFEQFESIGNVEGLGNAGNVLGRGLNGFQPSVQNWVDLTQRYLSDEMTTEEFIQQYQKSIDESIEDALKNVGLELSDLEHVERMPPERK